MQRLYVAGANTNYNLGILAPYQNPVFPFARVQQRPLVGNRDKNLGEEYGCTGDPLWIGSLSISNTHLLFTSNREQAILPLWYYIWGMGNNGYNQLGYAASQTGTVTWPVIAAATGVTLDVVALYNKSFRIDSGAVYGWGYNGGGALGIGSTTTQMFPVRCSGNMPQVATIVGDNTCTWFLCTNGQVYACGNNLATKLGVGAGFTFTTPVALNFSGMVLGDRVVGIAAGAQAGHAWTASGALYSWGQNGFRNTGIGGTVAYNTPVRMSESGVTYVSTSYYHSLMVSGTRLFACGRDSATGRLGMDGPAADVLTWTAVSGDLGVSGVKQAACQVNGSYAITTDGRLWAWGETAYTTGLLRPSGIVPSSPYFADRFIENTYSNQRHFTVIEVYNAIDNRASGSLVGHVPVSGCVVALGLGHIPQNNWAFGTMLGHLPAEAHIRSLLAGHASSVASGIVSLDSHGVQSILIGARITGHEARWDRISAYNFGVGLACNEAVAMIQGPRLAMRSMPVLLPAYIPRPASVCPILDPTASIQISPELIRIYQSRIDALVNQLGKNIHLEFEPVVAPCDNCLFDGMQNRSTGMYKPGGPLPFPRGQRCPRCKGKGVIETRETRCIKGLIKWNPRDYADGGLSAVDPKAIVRTKSYLSDAPLIRRASTAIMNAGVQNLMRLRVRRLRGPIPVGLRQPRYCITFWELVETD